MKKLSSKQQHLQVFKKQYLHIFISGWKIIDTFILQKHLGKSLEMSDGYKKNKIKNKSDFYCFVLAKIILFSWMLKLNLS